MATKIRDAGDMKGDEVIYGDGTGAGDRGARTHKLYGGDEPGGTTEADKGTTGNEQNQSSESGGRSGPVQQSVQDGRGANEGTDGGRAVKHRKGTGDSGDNGDIRRTGSGVLREGTKQSGDSGENQRRTDAGNSQTAQSEGIAQEDFMYETEKLLREMEGIAEPAQEQKRGKGRPKGSPNKKGTKAPPAPKKETGQKSVAKDEKKQFLPLSDIEKENLKAALLMAHELIDAGLWHAGLDTDPELGGMPIWALDLDELEVVSDFIFAMAEKRPAVNAAARKVIKVYEGWKLGTIYATRVGLTVYAFMTYGFNLRFSKKAVKEQMQKEGEK